MPTHRVRLKDQRELAYSTLGFYFEKPPGFTYQGGQFANLTLVDPPETDAEGNSRSFTLASAPYEDDLMVATRMRSTAFKQVLGRLTPGAEVKLAGPYGDFTLSPTSSRPAVFLAGGIGVTPFRSIILEALHHGVSRPLFLFYSNRRPEDAAFLDELSALAKAHANFRFVPIMTQPEKSARTWSGPAGRLSGAKVREQIPNSENPEFYLAGPPGFVDGLARELKAAGVPAQDLRTDEFDGYI